MFKLKKLILPFFLTIIISIIFSIFYLLGDRRYECKSFDFTLIEIDTVLHKKPLYYSNGWDTLEFVNCINYFSKTELAGNYGLSYSECNPYFCYGHCKSSKHRKINPVKYTEASSELYTEFYYEKDFDRKIKNIKVRFDIHLNEGEFFNERIDYKLLNKKETVTIENSYKKLKNILSIKRIKIERFFITEIEKVSGEKWHLIKIGDSILKKDVPKFSVKKIG